MTARQDPSWTQVLAQVPLWNNIAHVSSANHNSKKELFLKFIPGCYANGGGCSASKTKELVVALAKLLGGKNLLKLIQMSEAD